MCPELRCNTSVFTLAGKKFKSERNSLSKKALYLKSCVIRINCIRCFMSAYINIIEIAITRFLI